MDQLINKQEDIIYKALHTLTTEILNIEKEKKQLENEKSVSNRDALVQKKI